jgi:hypothetical protein
VRDVPAAADGANMPTLPTERSSATWMNFFEDHASELASQREQVHARELTPDIRRWAEAYKAVGKRDVYLWRWCLHGAELTTLPCVAPELVAHVCDTKILSIVICVLLDDVADQRGDSQLLNTLLDVTCWDSTRSLSGLSGAERRHAELVRALWQEYLDRIAGYPFHAAYEPVLRYDLAQVFNTMRYSHMVNRLPSLLNMVEHDLYTPHNMMMVSFATLDLMCSPNFALSELGALREVMRHTECMGRIGNLLSTWRRELTERDFTSGVFARAVMEGDLTLEELNSATDRQIEQKVRAGGHEEYFYRQWCSHRQDCRNRARQIGSLDLRQVLAGHDRFFAMYLGSRGLI